MVSDHQSLALDISHYDCVLETGRITLHEEYSRLRANEEIQAAYLGG